MSAPSTAYLTQVLPISNGSTTDALYLAIDLSAYAGNMKDLFYVDFFLSADKGSTKGVIGVVEDNSSLFNYKQHNSARFSKLRLKNPAGTKTYIVMNDGALNTRAEVTAQTLLTNYIGSFRVTGDFISAFYSLNTLVGVRYRIAYDGSTFGSWIEDSFMDSSGEAVTTTFSYDIKLNSVNYAVVGFDSAVEWQIFIENEEGRSTFETTIDNTVRLIPIQLRLSPSGSPQTYYTNTDDSQIVTSGVGTQANLVTQLFTSSTGLAPYLPYFGVLFRDDDPDIQYTFDTATVDGDTRSNYLTDITDIGIPGVTWIPINYLAFGGTTTQACRKAELGGEGVTYYINSVTLLVHATVGGAFPTDQYYIDFNDGINYRIIQITSGVRTDTGSTCSI